MVVNRIALRPALLPPPLDEEVLSKVIDLIGKIESVTRDTAEERELMQEFNELTGQNWRPWDIWDWHCATETIAETALTPRTPKG